MPNINQPSYEVPLPTVKIASFNLLNYLEPPMAYYDFQNIYTTEQWHKKLAWITRFLTKNQPDIIGFQEVFSSESLQTLLESAGYPYYAVVDTPTVIDDFIYRSPVVAIASKFPIVEIAPVSADQQAASLLGLSEFHFSRQPLRATIDIPHIGLTDCYVTHFKSKRSLFDDPLPDTIVPSETALSRFAGQRLGSWGSAMLRGTEANLLLLAILKQRESSTRPMLLMGDFNDELSSSCLEQLIAGNVFGMSDSDIKRLIGYYRLYDSWDLFTQNTEQVSLLRSPTHYFGSKTSVLDYILLSQEFNAQYLGSLFEVSDYHTEDKHLINSSFDEDGYSTDHAIPCVTLSLRN
ncbi:endonuclease/exonuclease/phosphatase family protein [Photobacterium kishitanii]|uniref:endonuclease/exonuclease/phosphatase family protein n=1 Tax=Photobacterium kishitanii TaxID=318456 RepID=UPI001EFD168E|nr:endonuclease/exonuclease/phosphatase family protein [Photobacterium kishitanii]